MLHKLFRKLYKWFKLPNKFEAQRIHDKIAGEILRKEHVKAATTIR